MRDNLFAVLGIQSREDCVSNALAYAFNASPSFRNEFLHVICGINLKEYTSTRAYTEISTGRLGMPDIVITLEAQARADLVIIENKLEPDLNDRTSRYSSARAIADLRNRLLPGKELGDTTFVFLTLFPDQHPTCPAYAIHWHSELKQLAAAISDCGNELAKRLISDWLALVESFYEKENVHPSDQFYEKLAHDNGFDGGYLYFRRALEKLDLPAALELKYFRYGDQGRRYYCADISKEAWHPAEMKEVSGSWSLDPSTNYRIRLESRYDILSGVFNCFLHYEVNTYELEGWLKENIPPDQYNGYLERRIKFAAELQLQPIPGWLFGDGSYEIAKTTFDFSISTYAEVKTTLEREIGKMAQAIDSVIKQE